MACSALLTRKDVYRMVRDVEDDSVREKRQLNWLAKAESRPGFLIEDISKGLEKVHPELCLLSTWIPAW